MKKSQELFEVIRAVFLRIEKFLFDEPLDERIDESFQEERVSETGQKSWHFSIDSPHAERQERFIQSLLGHELFVFLIKSDLFFKETHHIFAVIDQHEEILPKMEIILPQIKYILLARIALVLWFQKCDKLRTVVVRIVDVLFVAASQTEVLSYTEIFLFFCYFVAVRHEIIDFLVHESLQIIWIYSWSVVKFKIEVLPFRRVGNQFFVEFVERFIVGHRHRVAEIFRKTVC